MKIAGVKLVNDADEQDESYAVITLELMGYEVQELANQERERIERGLPVGDARIAIERYSMLRLALNKAAEAKRT